MSGRFHHLVVEATKLYAGRRMTRAVASLLAKWDVDFGILGEAERCDGNEVRALGESGLFEQLAKQKIDQLEAAGVRKIVTLSSHAFHAIRNDYPGFGGDFEVFHYSQLLAALPGVELVEMDRARADALCCGGGGGNFSTDVLGGGVDSSARVRVREAAGTDDARHPRGARSTPPWGRADRLHGGERGQRPSDPRSISDLDTGPSACYF